MHTLHEDLSYSHTPILPYSHTPMHTLQEDLPYSHTPILSYSHAHTAGRPLILSYSHTLILSCTHCRKASHTLILPYSHTLMHTLQEDLSYSHTPILSYSHAHSAGRPLRATLPGLTICTTLPQPHTVVQPLPLGHHQCRPSCSARTHVPRRGPRVRSPAHSGRPGAQAVRPAPEWPLGAGAGGLQGQQKVRVRASASTFWLPTKIFNPPPQFSRLGILAIYMYIYALSRV